MKGGVPPRTVVFPFEAVGSQDCGLVGGEAFHAEEPLVVGAVEALNVGVSPGLGQMDEDRLKTQLQAEPKETRQQEGVLDRRGEGRFVGAF